MCLYLPIHLVGLALQSSSVESIWLAETWDEYSVFMGFRQASGTCVYSRVCEKPGIGGNVPDSRPPDTRPNLATAAGHPQGVSLHFTKSGRVPVGG